MSNFKGMFVKIDFWKVKFDWKGIVKRKA